MAWGWRYDLLDADLVAPRDVEVVLVEEALAGPQAEIGQADLVGVVGEAEPAEVGDAVRRSLPFRPVQAHKAPIVPSHGKRCCVPASRFQILQRPRSSLLEISINTK